MSYLALQIPGPNGANYPIIGPTGIPQGGAIELNHIVDVFLGILVLIAVVLCLLFLLWGAFNWITSEGDKTKIESARQKIIYAILGLVVVFASFLVINLIYQFFFGHLSTGIGL
jgi:magnesium-transporting ATPase (P-type)